VITVVVNGVERTAEVEPRVTLAELLRDRLDLTGTHLGCEHGVCGACTVLLDDVPARACLVLAVQCDGRRVVTVEGWAAADGTLHPLQQAWLDTRAFQCGFCTPGFLATAYDLLRDDPAPSEADARACLSANLCRCTGYQPIVEGILRLAGRDVPPPGCEG
jgi:aerobic-type carbon monoxide dehydrogenase small subunit (CoxS/CutS family)